MTMPHEADPETEPLHRPLRRDGAGLWAVLLAEARRHTATRTAAFELVAEVGGTLEGQALTAASLLDALELLEQRAVVHDRRHPPGEEES